MSVDFADIRGQEAVKRALLVAIAGRHPIALIGPSGWGKSMLAEAVDFVCRQLPRPFGMEIQTVTTDHYPPSSMDGNRSPLAWENYQNVLLCDMHIEVPPVPFRELTGKQRGTDSRYFLEKIQVAKQHKDLTLSDSCLLLAKQAFSELGLTARGFDAVRRVARTIANLDHSEKIQEIHLAEAVQYRLVDRKDWSR